MKDKINWNIALQPLIDKYKGKKHFLDYENLYQLFVLMIIAAQDSNNNINSLAPKFFETFPDMPSLAKATPDSLFPLISKVRNFGSKTNWLLKNAQTLKEDKNIPLTKEGLTALPGISRTSANVILREFGINPIGTIMDLRVVRVAPRLGISKSTHPAEIEKDIMENLDEASWADATMGMAFLGAEICRPSDPKHHECVMNEVCDYYKKIKNKKIASKKK